MKMSWKWPAAVAVLGGVGALLALSVPARDRLGDLWNRVTTRPARTDSPGPATPAPTPSQSPWDGVLTLSKSQQQAIGLRFVAAEAQTEPTVLRLAGMTDYDPSTLTIVRTQFDSRVDNVLVDLGHVVKKGDPLLELFSNTLAEAKSAFETALNQHAHDKKVLDYKKPLAESNTLPRKELIEIENDEANSLLAMKLARDKLQVYGLSDAEIDGAKREDGVRKARMTLRAVADGIVIKRGVVRGNLIDPKDDLLTIAPLDHLWVRGSVSEMDADKVQIGQALNVVFPYSQHQVKAKVEYIDQAIDPDSRAGKFRTSISNPGRALKSGAYVRVLVDIPPVPGRVVIPRVAMVSVDRSDYAFVRKAGSPDRYERRLIVVAKESNDIVIVAEPSSTNPGIAPGDEVVTSGSLILEQMYEDKVITESGTVE